MVANSSSANGLNNANDDPMHGQPKAKAKAKSLSNKRPSVGETNWEMEKGELVELMHTAIVEHSAKMETIVKHEVGLIREEVKVRQYQ